MPSSRARSSCTHLGKTPRGAESLSATFFDAAVAGAQRAQRAGRAAPGGLAAGASAGSIAWAYSLQLSFPAHSSTALARALGPQSPKMGACAGCCCGCRRVFPLGARCAWLGGRPPQSSSEPSSASQLPSSTQRDSRSHQARHPTRRAHPLPAGPRSHHSPAPSLAPPKAGPPPTPAAARGEERHSSPPPPAPGARLVRGAPGRRCLQRPAALQLARGRGRALRAGAPGRQALLR